MHAQPKIAIVGGGPGGLTLARLLHLQGRDVTVFEREAHALERPQGGTLDLHEESGLLALKNAQLFDEFLTIARYDDQGTRLLDKTGRVVFEDAGSPEANRPEVDRTELRALLLASLPDGCMQWGSALRAMKHVGYGRRLLALGDGQEAGPFDLVVGADGAWSRIRPMLSPYKPQYSGLSFLEFGLEDVDRAQPALSHLVGKGKLVVEGEGKSIIAQRNGNAVIRGYAVFRVPAEWVSSRFDLDSPAATRASLLQEFHGFADEILDLLRASDDSFASRPIFALPVGHQWPNQRGLTLIGDAAHLMSPYAGEGVNAAMQDAMELADQLAKVSDWASAVANYEAHMFVRVVAAATASAEAAATQLSHDGLALTEATYRSHMQAH